MKRSQKRQKVMGEQIVMRGEGRVLRGKQGKERCRFDDTATKDKIGFGRGRR